MHMLSLVVYIVSTFKQVIFAQWLQGATVGLDVVGSLLVQFSAPPTCSVHS